MFYRVQLEKPQQWKNKPKTIYIHAHALLSSSSEEEKKYIIAAILDEIVSYSQISTELSNGYANSELLYISSIKKLDENADQVKYEVFISDLFRDRSNNNKFQCEHQKKQVVINKTVKEKQNDIVNAIQPVDNFNDEAEADFERLMHLFEVSHKIYAANTPTLSPIIGKKIAEEIDEIYVPLPEFTAYDLSSAEKSDKPFIMAARKTYTDEEAEKAACDTFGLKHETLDGIKILIESKLKVINAIIETLTNLENRIGALNEANLRLGKDIIDKVILTNKSNDIISAKQELISIKTYLNEQTTETKRVANQLKSCFIDYKNAQEALNYFKSLLAWKLYVAAQHYLLKLNETGIDTANKVNRFNADWQTLGIFLNDVGQLNTFEHGIASLFIKNNISALQPLIQEMINKRNVDCINEINNALKDFEEIWTRLAKGAGISFKPDDKEALFKIKTGWFGTKFFTWSNSVNDLAEEYQIKCEQSAAKVKEVTKIQTKTEAVAVGNETFHAMSSPIEIEKAFNIFDDVYKRIRNDNEDIFDRVSDIRNSAAVSSEEIAEYELKAQKAAEEAARKAEMALMAAEEAAIRKAAAEEAARKAAAEEVARQAAAEAAVRKAVAEEAVRKAAADEVARKAAAEEAARQAAAEEAATRKAVAEEAAIRKAAAEAAAKEKIAQLKDAIIDILSNKDFWQSTLHWGGGESVNVTINDRVVIGKFPKGIAEMLKQAKNSTDDFFTQLNTVAEKSEERAKGFKYNLFSIRDEKTAAFYNLIKQKDLQMAAVEEWKTANNFPEQDVKKTVSCR